MAAKQVLRDDIDKFFEYGIYLPNRHMYMGSVGYVDDGETGTDHFMAERAIKNLHILDSLAPDGTQPITIIMNNIGGDEYHCLAIYDAIMACRNHVTMIGTGYVMSAGSLIFQAADDRVLTPNARMMIHYGTWGMYDHPKIMYKWAEEGKKIDQVMRNIYLERMREKHPDYLEEDLDKMLNFDTILDPYSAVELGLADRVVD